MKKLLILVFIAYPLTIHATNCKPSTTCQPGEVVIVPSPSLDKAKFTISNVTLTSANASGVNFDTPVEIVGTNDTELSFVIPKEVVDGTYLIQIKLRAVDQQQQGQTPAPITIEHRSIVIERPSITAISPTAAYRDNHGVNTVIVLGKGFRKDASSFYFTKLKRPELCDQITVNEPKTNCYDLKVDSERQIILSFHSLDASAGYYGGPQEFLINVDGLETNTSNLALINHSESLVITLALLGVAVIFAIVYLLIYSGRESIKQTFGTKSYLRSALFLDVQTYSYSLSKCQFYAWTAAAVIGYLFLAVSKSYVQGSATFPDIPSGLPGILLASAGTAVLSTAITSVKGDKGAGNPVPNFSDFITSGGVIAADRLQFAVWTLVGILTFLTIVFMSDPRNINDLPSIPSGFLQIMGISAAGYIGGKLARKPGPTLDAISISSGDPTLELPGKPKELTFQLTGSGLSQSASFSIDGEPIFPDTIRGKDDNSKLPELVQQDPTIGDPNFARILRVRVVQPRDSWLGGTTKHNFTITNPDSQRATQLFQIFKVNEVKITSADQKLAITGEFLDKNLKVEYSKPGEPSKFNEVSSPESTDATHYTAKVEANLKSPVTVKISDTAGVAVEEEVPVA